MEFHDLANMFPPIESEAFDELCEDIKANGLQEPIIIFEGKILDGRNRYLACRRLNIEPRYSDFSGDPVALVISRNIKRRHLTPNERAMLVRNFRLLAVGDVESQVSNKKEENSAGCAQPPYKSEEVGKILGISRSMVKDANKVFSSGTPEQIKAVEAGRVTIRATARKMRGAKPEKKRRNMDPEKPEHSDRLAARIERQRMQAEITGRLKNGLTELTSLPLPSEVAAIARKMSPASRKEIDARVESALIWLKEFYNVWSNTHAQAAISASDGTDHVDAGNGERVA